MAVALAFAAYVWPGKPLVTAIASTGREHVTRVDVRTGRLHPVEWEIICKCGWGVVFGTGKVKRKAYREATRWAEHHETLNSKG